MPRASRQRDVTPPETQFTQFEQHSDDSDTLWNAVCILAEKGNLFLVKWEGTDDATGEPWPDSWVVKEDCTDPLIKEWHEKKRKIKEEKLKLKKGLALQRAAAIKKSESRL